MQISFYRCWRGQGAVGQIGVRVRQWAIGSELGREFSRLNRSRIASGTGRMKGFGDLTIIKWKSHARIQAQDRIRGFLRGRAEVE